MKLSFQIVDTAMPCLVAADIDSFVVAGWAGRDVAAIEHHIQELSDLGVPRPSAYPLYYRVAANQLTQASMIQVLGTDSSGEAEVFMFASCSEMFVSLVSDHTDRRLEAHSVAVSKQVCAKPVAATAWRFADVSAHWDDLILRSTIEENGSTIIYQEGRLAALRHPLELIAGYCRSIGLAGSELAVNTAMSCGTLAAVGGIRSAGSFAMELFDPHRNCSLVHRYSVESLAVVS